MLINSRTTEYKIRKTDVIVNSHLERASTQCGIFDQTL